jgi:molybdopterin molybdotransferase
MQVPWPKARRIAREVAKPLDAVQLPLDEAVGAALAGPLCARFPQPLGDVAAMDGYAVAGPAPWQLTGRILAGDPAGVALCPGQATEIATGAVVPPRADAVVPYERAERNGHRVTGPLGKRAHIRQRGEDFEAGETLVTRGSVVTPAVVGMAAGIGQDDLFVHRRPRVQVLITGNELLFSGPPRPGRVRDAIGPMLTGLVRAAGGEISATAHLHDDPAALADALDRSEPDVFAVCGATSAGAADHLRSALRRARADIVVDGVACRPGHPQMLATLPGGGFVVGLPGNPYAALVAVLTLLAPLLGSLAGRNTTPAVTATLVPGPAPHVRDTLLLAAVRRGSIVVPVGHDRPGSLRAPATADVLAVLPPDWPGGQVELLPLAG